MLLPCARSPPVLPNLPKQKWCRKYTCKGTQHNLNQCFLGHRHNGYTLSPSIASMNPPPPACKSYALVQATAGVGTVLIWNLICFATKCSAAT